MQGRTAASQPELIPPAPVDKSALLLGAPRRIRDPEHLRFINAQPCLICGRAPVHAHHLRFAQPRSMGNKVSDEWAVPLCFTHHRALHTVGNEEGWWAEKGIDAKAEAQKLWRLSHGIPEATEVDMPASAKSASDQACKARQGPDAGDHVPASSLEAAVPWGEDTAASPLSERRVPVSGESAGGEKPAPSLAAGADAGGRDLPDVAAE